MKSKIGFAVGFLVILFSAAIASAGTLVEINDIRQGDLEMVGFELTQGAEVDIEAVGVRTRYSKQMAVYAWIIDHETRQPVWVMSLARSAKHKESRALRFAEKVKFLEKGKYELYMYAGDLFTGNFNVSGSKDFFDLLGDIFDDEEDQDDEYYYRDVRYYLDDCYVKVSSEEIGVDKVKTFDVNGDFSDALARFNGVGNDEYIRQMFTLDKPMNLRIYSLIEHPRGWDAPVDGAWIVNAETREKVWQMDRWNTERAGGGKKNRKFDDEVRLDKGTYVLHYASDDSHSAEEFNVAPPYDPLNWGVTLFPGKDLDPSAFHLVDKKLSVDPLIDFSRARNDDFMEQAFELKKDCQLRVYALGECTGKRSDFADYGWIENAVTGKTVWEMTWRNTEPAGGGDKNRMFDGIIDLEKGKYIAFYTTDDSHAYRSWNVKRPFDPSAWGMTIYGGEGMDAKDMTFLTEAEVMDDSKVLCSLTRVRDRERRRANFALSKETKVNILAIGEYSAGDRNFCDYGWIEDAKTGKTVWEMTRRNTDHAGGGDKNRMFDGTVTLDKGEYDVFYISDGSHSFNDWNVRQPDNPRKWGITVTLAE